MVKVGDYEVPEGLYFSEDFEWIKVEGDKVRMGISDYAQKQLREIVYIELPEEGAELIQNEPYGTLESVKAVSDLISALSGTIEKVNKEIQSNPEILKHRSFWKRMVNCTKPFKVRRRKKKFNEF